MFQSHAGSIEAEFTKARAARTPTRFNPTLVRLRRERRRRPAAGRGRRFNPTLVRLRPTATSEKPSPFLTVSIPRWFD